MGYLDKIQKEEVVIYGAANSAYNMYYLLSEYQVKPRCFCVSDVNSLKVHEICGIEIISACEAIRRYPQAYYLIACRREAYAEIVDYIEKEGIEKYEYAGLDSGVDMELRKKHFEKVFSYIPAPQTQKVEDLAVYMVKCHKDKSVASRQYPNYVKCIQAGAARTDMVISDIRDNQGENISTRNNNYSECSAIYWLWKHARNSYIGLCHYRRMFSLSREQICNYFENGADILIPCPGFYAPTVKEAYLKSIPEIPWMEKDWNLMMEKIKELQPAHYESAAVFERGHYFVHYNMMITRRDIFAEWCEFLFAVLFAVEEEYFKENIIRDDRYLGYLAEALTSIYLFEKKSQYNIVTVDVETITK